MLLAGFPIVAICLPNKRPNDQSIFLHSAVGRLPALLDQGAEAHGFAGEVWTPQRVAELLTKQLGVTYHPAHMSRLLKRINYSVQKPIERASQRDEAAIATRKEQRWPALKQRLARGPHDRLHR